MTTLLAARGEHFAASLGLHPRAEAVRLVTPAYLRLKRPFRQPELLFIPALFMIPAAFVLWTRLPAMSVLLFLMLRAAER